MTKRFGGVLFAAAVAATVIQASQVAITNPSFELPALPDGGTGAPTGWTTSGSALAFNPTAATATVFDGSQVLLLQGNASAAQTLSTVLTPNTLYELFYDVGSRADGSPISDYQVSLEVGGTVLKAKTGTSGVPVNGAHLGNVIQFTTSSSHPGFGQPLTIRLAHTGTNARSALMDRVVLQVEESTCGPFQRYSRPLDIWYGAVTVRNSANAVIATQNFVQFDRFISSGIRFDLQGEAIDQRVKDDASNWVFPPDLTNIEWVLDSTAGSDARQALLSSYGTAGGVFGPGTLAPGTAVNSPVVELITDVFTSPEDNGSGGACDRVNLFSANVSVHELNATYTLSGAPAWKCPLTHGYWKNNPTSWPVSSLELGSLSYNPSELLAILRAGGSKDASLILGRQLIAAQLNIANGADPSQIIPVITNAHGLISSSRVPAQVSPSSSRGQAMTAAANALGDYNSGLLTPVCVP